SSDLRSLRSLSVFPKRRRSSNATFLRLSWLRNKEALCAGLYSYRNRAQSRSALSQAAQRSSIGSARITEFVSRFMNLVRVLSDVYLNLTARADESAPR